MDLQDHHKNLGEKVTTFDFSEMKYKMTVSQPQAGAPCLMGVRMREVEDQDQPKTTPEELFVI